MSLNVFSSGVNTSFTSELNDNFNSISVKEVYTGTDLDINNTTGTVSSSYEFNNISSNELGNADYLLIRLLVYSHIQQDANNTTRPSASITIQTEDLTNLTYSDSLSKTSFHSFYSGGDETIMREITWVHTLTTDEKNNGVKIKVIIDTAGVSSGDKVVVNVKQVVISTINN